MQEIFLAIFRGIDAAASLKRKRREFRLAGFNIFRGIDAAASLKPSPACWAAITCVASSAASMPRPH